MGYPPNWFEMNQMIQSSSHGGLGVERSLHKKCHFAPVDRIPLEDVYGTTIGPAMHALDV